MIAVDAATTVDASAIVAPLLLSLLAFVALYVWTALALSAVFRKAGEEGWKAWVPFLNFFVLLELGGLSGWLVLLALVPFLGALAVWVVLVIACYRVNVAFGFGAGMTVLAALLFPVWATVVGFGSARWLGAEHAGGVRRSTTARSDDASAFASADAGPPPPLPSTAPAPRGLEGWAPASPAAGPVRPAPPLPPAAAAATPSADIPAPAPPAPPPEEPISFVPLASSAARSAPAAPPAPPLPSGDDVLAEPAAPAPASASRANQGWGGFDLGAVGELTSEVTAAVSGAPAPVSAIPREEPDAPEPTPAVTRVPAARPTVAGEPWAPARSPFPESDAFPEASGEVSAVAGAPDAGIPRSARSSVSAQHVLPELPDDDDVEHTVIANRRKAHWSLVLPTGSTVALVADVVLVGRRPAPSTAYPDAQLIEVDDGTVSKTHLRLERVGEDWSVTDLHSTNGTVLIASDGAEREIPPGAAHRAPARLLLGDAELRLAPDDASR